MKENLLILLSGALQAFRFVVPESRKVDKLFILTIHGTFTYYIEVHKNDPGILICDLSMITWSYVIFSIFFFVGCLV